MANIGALKDGTPFAPRAAREQTQVPALHQGSGGVRRRARHGLRAHRHRHGGYRPVGRQAEHFLHRATPISPRATRVYALIAGLHRQRERRTLASEPALAQSQIHRFVILNRELERRMTACSRAPASCAATSSPRATARWWTRCMTAEREVRFEAGSGEEAAMRLTRSATRRSLHPAQTRRAA